MPIIFTIAEVDLVLITLSLIDITLVGGLLIMVMFSGYENFVSRLDIGDETEKLSWLGKLDSGSLKQKVAASIVAISSIHLLQKFMNLENADKWEPLWYVVIHLTFVLSALGMAWVDMINKNQKYK